MKILIIGGTNFIGPFLVRHLLTMGHDVILFHRGKTKTESKELSNGQEIIHLVKCSNW